MLISHGVPYEGLVYVFEKDENYWCRIETRFGRKNIVATTVKTVEIPEDLLADEHHTWINGDAGAGQELFPTIVTILCFLHAWLRIRERGKKLENFFDLGGKVWEVYYSETKKKMGRRIRRLHEWATTNLSGVVQEKTLDLCDRSTKWSLWYEERCANAYATSNALDRLMRSRKRYFERGQHFHGTLRSANLRSRSWAILHNYWDRGRKTRTENAGYRCPAERLNGKRYADNWLENLLVATSVVPKRKMPPLKTA